MRNKGIIKPITDLRNTNEISKLCHESDEPIFITKNGYDDLVVMSNETFDKIGKKSTNDSDFPIQSSCHNMVKVACATNYVRLASPMDNVEEIAKIIQDSKKHDLDILLFPELSLSGYSCGDVFFFDTLLKTIELAIEELRKKTIKNHTLIFVGAPLVYHDKLYNCAIAMCDGTILGVVPKSNLPRYNEFYENRQFSAYNKENSEILINGKLYPFGTKLIFSI